MSLLSRLRSLAGAIHPSGIEQEMEEELRSHIHNRAADLEQSGLPPAEAERRARIEFGTYERLKEECRESLGMYRFERLRQDVRFGVRMLSKTPAFTFIAILTLAFAIGANTAIFSVVNEVMLQSLPVRDPERLVVLRWSAHHRPNHFGISSFGDCERLVASDTTGCSVSYTVFKKIQAQSRLFANVMAFAGTADIDLNGNGPASMVSAELVSGTFFPTLGVSPVLGRTLEPADEEPRAEATAVLSYAYWQSAFGGSSAVIGRTIRLNGIPFTIVGVTEPGFTRLTPGKSPDLWLSLSQLAPLGLGWGGGKGLDDPASWWLTITARLSPGVSRSQAQAAIGVLFRNDVLHGEKPFWSAADDPTITLIPAQKALVGIRQQFGNTLNLLIAAVGIVLLIACANVAGLMLARATGRQREMAVRLALGARRHRIIQQLLTESVLLSLCGSALGILLAYWGVRGLGAFLSANGYSSLPIDPRPDAPVLLFTITVAALTGIGFGLAPAFRGASVKITPGLASNAETASDTTARPFRQFGLGRWLVILQVALSVVVLISAGLLMRTVQNLHSVDVGFETRNLLLFSINPTLAGYKGERIQQLYRELQSRLAVVPGVVSTSYSSDALLAGGLWTSTLRIEGQSETVQVQMLAVGPDFFETMRIPLAIGRTFGTADLDSPQAVAIVNKAFVQRFAASKYPVGLHFQRDGSKDPPFEVVGVVGDTKYESVKSRFAPTAYILLKETGATYALRTASEPVALIPSVRKVVNDIDDNLPVVKFRTQTEAINRYLFNERMVTGLLTLFGILGLVLSCIGLYGLLSYNVALRTREIGIRTALGARRYDALLLIVREGVVLMISGSALGTLVAIAVTRLLQSLLFGIRPTDLMTFGSVWLLLAVVGLAACLVPATRATHIEPVVALRYE